MESGTVRDEVTPHGMKKFHTGNKIKITVSLHLQEYARACGKSFYF